LERFGATLIGRSATERRGNLMQINFGDRGILANMKTKTNTKITLEKRQRTTIRLRRRKPTAAWCERCAAETEMLAPDEAALVSGTTQMAVFRLLENGELHFMETGAGALLICRNSLKNNNYKTKGV
jgi:hypothetical protein